MVCALWALAAKTALRLNSKRLPWRAVAAGLGHHNDLGVLAEFGGGGVGDHLEFRDVVQRGDLAEEALADGIVVRHAVDGLAGAAAIGCSGDGGVGACLLDAGRHGHEAVDAGAAIEGHGFDLVSIDDVADGGSFGLDDGRRAADVNGGADAADREFDIDARGLVHQDANIAANLSGETFGGDLELVGSGGEAGEGEIAFRGGGGGDGDAGTFVYEFDLGIRNGGLGGVGDASDDGAGGLGEQRQTG